MLPTEARYDTILKLPNRAHLGTALVEAMNAIERSVEPLLGQLPKDHDRFAVAPTEEDEDFDFEQTMQEIHAELKEPNAEAATLEGKLEANFAAIP